MTGKVPCAADLHEVYIISARGCCFSTVTCLRRFDVQVCNVARNKFTRASGGRGDSAFAVKLISSADEIWVYAVLEAAIYLDIYNAFSCALGCSPALVAVSNYSRKS